MRRYKFCVAMENSIRQDYMTEKLWDGLIAGCIPIYLGNNNAPHIVPHPDSFIRWVCPAEAQLAIAACVLA